MRVRLEVCVETVTHLLGLTMNGQALVKIGTLFQEAMKYRASNNALQRIASAMEKVEATAQSELEAIGAEMKTMSPADATELAILMAKAGKHDA